MKATIDKNYGMMTFHNEVCENLLAVREMYKNNDSRHNENHFDDVMSFGIDTMLRLLNVNSDYSNINPEMLSITLAYHDLGRLLGTESHSKNSAKMLNNSTIISKYYKGFEIETMVRVVKNHSNIIPDKSLYGFILKDADKSFLLDKYDLLRRLVLKYYDKKLNTVEILDSVMNKLLYMVENPYVANCEVNRKLFNDSIHIIKNITSEDILGMIEYIR